MGVQAFLQSHWQRGAGSRTILVVSLAGRWVAWLTSSQSVPLGSQEDNQCVSLPASWLSEWHMDLQAAWLAACLALRLPDGWFTCCPAPQMPGRLPAQFAWSWVRLWAQNSLLCKAGDYSVGVLFSSNLECPMKQKFPSQQGLVISLQHLSMYSVHGNLGFLRLKKHLAGNACNNMCLTCFNFSDCFVQIFSSKVRKDF